MRGHVIIDGNNLLHAMHAHAPLPNVGRETLVRVIERWARGRGCAVSIVFDGPPPRGGMRAQLASKLVGVQFSAPVTADDVIVEMVNAARDPGRVCVVTSDKAIVHAARGRRCQCCGTKPFIDAMFRPDGSQRAPAGPRDGDADRKPDGSCERGARAWLEAFGFEDDDEPFDGYEAMTY